jgi:MFS family permease
MAIVGVGWASIVSLPFAIMSEKVEPGRMGFFMGMFNLSVVLPQLFVSLVLGSVIQNSDDKTIIFLISGTALAASTLIWTFVREDGGAAPGASRRRTLMVSVRSSGPCPVHRSLGHRVVLVLVAAASLWSVVAGRWPHPHNHLAPGPD